jgi:hypothetical protein
VSFSKGATLLGSVNVNSSGVATYLTSSLPLGADNLSAAYSGNSGFATSTSSVFTETINAPTLTSTAVALAASPNPATVGTSVSFTATVSPAPTGATRGAVSFYDGSSLLGTESVNSSGIATFTSANLAAGALSITAAYSGDTQFAASTSSLMTETVNTTYMVTAPQSPVTAAAGAAVQIKVTVPPVGGAYNSVVTMSATGLPSGASVSFNPSTVIPESAGASTTLTIQLAAVSAHLFDPRLNFPDRRLPFSSFPLAAFALTVGFCAIGFKSGSSAKKHGVAGVCRILAFAVVALAACSLTACGGGSAKASNTQAGNYTVNITGTSGSTHVSTHVTLEVQ